MRILAALALALMAGVVPARAAPPDPVAMVQEARSLAAGGKPGDAVRLIETWLNRNGATLGPADLAVLWQEAARQAGDADPAAARRDLAKADAALARTAAGIPPVLLGRFHRDSARLHERVGDMTGADRHLVVALAAFGSADLPAAAEAANALGTVRMEQSRPAEAAVQFRRSVALLGCGAGASPPCAVALANAANALATANDLPAAREAAAGALRAAGSDPRSIRAATLARGQILVHDLDPAAAEAALASVAGLAAGQDEALRGFALYLTASARFDRGLLPEAAEAAMAADGAYRAALGDRHPARARVVHLLAVIDTELGDNAHAAFAFDQAQAMARRSFGDHSVQEAVLGLERVRIDLRQGNVATARARWIEAVGALAATTEPDPQMQARTAVARGLIAAAEHRDTEAAQAFATAANILSGPAHRPVSPEMGFALLQGGRALTRLDRLDAAQVTLDRALEVQTRLGTAATTWRAEVLAARGQLLLRRGEGAAALAETRGAEDALREQIGLGSLELGPVRDEARDVLAVHAQVAAEVLEPQDALKEAFAAAQLALASRTGDSIRRTAIRLAQRSDALAILLREQEAVADQLRQTETLLRDALLRFGVGTGQEEARLSIVRDGLRTRLRLLGDRLRTEQPQFVANVAPAVASVGEVRSALAADQAMLLVFDTEEGTLLFALTRDDARLVRSSLSRAEVTRLVHALRGGLDLERLQAGSAPVPFDVAASETLYAGLIGPVEPVVAGRKRLVVVASGPLQTLPFAVLLDPTRHEWLIRRHALSTTPSPAAFLALRQPSRLPREAFFGVGDPLFSRDTVAPTRSPTEATDLRQAVLRLPALPQTREELSRMAALFTAADTRLLLGADATPAAVLERSGSLAGTVAFATHAAMAGELPGLLEPVIFLTPGTQGDLGLLPASEVATMELDADLVILSACNTAAPDGGPMAEGFSGLARAFLQAGAHALLVSHWAVDDRATTRLTTDFMSRLRSDLAGDKASALQAAMVDLLDGPDLELRHPAFWAPFVLVGE